MMENDLLKTREHHRFVKRVFRSIRTRYSLTTAFFLLMILAMFYSGGRIVLVHMMREAEERVRTVWLDLSGVVRQSTHQIRGDLHEVATQIFTRENKDESIANLLNDARHSSIAFLADCSDSTNFLASAVYEGGLVVPLAPEEMQAYDVRFRAWRESIKKIDAKKQSDAIGIIALRGRLYCVTLFQSQHDARIFAIGAPFDLTQLSARVSSTLAGVDVKIGHSVVRTPLHRTSHETLSFGIAPMLSEAFNFYSGGFWEIQSRPLDATFAIRDIAGGPVATIALSVPQTLTGVAHTALGRLGFFVAIAGIILIIPVFWYQGHMLLNPLTKMTQEIVALTKKTDDLDCPRLEWRGKDEFAYLALSVNRMLEMISARKIELAQLEARQRALIQGVPDALVVFDVTGRLVSIYKQAENMDTLPGFQLGETLSSSVYTDGEIALFQTQLMIVSQTGEITSLRLRANALTMEATRYLELRMSRMDEHFVLGILRDVTMEISEHHLRLAAERRAADTSKRESITLLAAGIAHDVNNVLSVILNTVESSVHDVNCRQAVRDAVKRGSHMTKELMTVAGEAKMALTRISPSFIIHDVQLLMSRLAKENIEISYALADDTPDVDIDPNQFWKVLFNIVKNAVESIGTNPGRVEISTKRCQMTTELAANFISENTLLPGLGVIFSLADDGPGIPPALLNRLFDPYVSSKARGRGLGLATVRAIIDAHGGGIQVESVVGRGTTFRIFLPESHLPPVAAREVREPTKESPQKSELPREVLVVDNDEAILRTSSILMKALGITVYTAHDRAEALAILRRHTQTIDAIVLDAHLGEVDTAHMSEALRAASVQSRLIITSGSSEEEIRKMFASCSFDAFLAKPWTLTELKAALASVATV